jgi:flavoprotein
MSFPLLKKFNSKLLVRYSEILYKSTAEIRVPRPNGWVKIGLYDFLIEIRLS